MKRRGDYVWSSVIAAVLVTLIPTTGQADDGRLVAVLNFENRGQGDVAWDWLSKGLADLTIGDLHGQGLRVVSREQMQEMVREGELERKQVGPTMAGQVLKASRCVVGNYRADATSLELNALVMDAATGRQLHAARVNGASQDFFTLQKRLSANLAEFLNGQRAGTLDALTLVRWTESVPAAQLLYQAVDLFDQGEYLAAWSLVRRALRHDPKYADAWYWSARLMYYCQEYHHARLDLEDFARRHPKHPRAGDAVIEWIAAAQLSAQNGDEVLTVLTRASEIAPRATIHNQFGSGNSSTVEVYAAAMAARILESQGHGLEAFHQLQRALGAFRKEEPLYWILWHEIFALQVRHLRDTGELWELPPRPPAAAQYLSPGGRHPSSVGTASAYFGGRNRGGDEPLGREFVSLSPARPAIEIDFNEDPLLPAKHLHRTFTRYFTSGRDHFLTSFEVEIRYHHDPAFHFQARLEGDTNSAWVPLDKTGAARFQLAIAPGKRLVALRLNIASRDGAKSDLATTAVHSWKMTARFQSSRAPAGDVVLHTAQGQYFEAWLDDLRLPLIDGRSVLSNVPAGKHKLRFQPEVWVATPQAEESIEVIDGEVVEIALSATVDPRAAIRGTPRPQGHPQWTKRISTSGDVFRAGPYLGDRPMKDQVHFSEDQQGRWIVVWNVLRDLYLTTSADRGATWTPTVRLSAPVNSAHDERSPSLTQAADGRFLLTFSSDRNLAHANAVYACWSYDLHNFSAPVMVSAETSQAVRILESGNGSYLVYLLVRQLVPAPGFPGRFNAQDHWMVSSSSDLVHWSSTMLFPGKRTSGKTLEVFRSGGRFVALRGERRKLWMYDSGDGISFSEGREIPVVYRPEIQGRIYASEPLIEKIVCRQTATETLIVAGDTWQAVLFSHGADGNLTQVGHLPPQADLRSVGDLAVTDRDLLFFFMRPQPHLDADYYLTVNPAWFVQERPLEMARWPRKPELLPSDAASLQPSNLRADIVRRYPRQADSNVEP